MNKLWYMGLALNILGNAIVEYLQPYFIRKGTDTGIFIAPNIPVVPITLSYLFTVMVIFNILLIFNCTYPTIKIEITNKKLIGYIIYGFFSTIGNIFRILAMENLPVSLYISISFLYLPITSIFFQLSESKIDGNKSSTFLYQVVYWPLIIMITISAIFTQLLISSEETLTSYIGLVYSTITVIIDSIVTIILSLISRDTPKEEGNTKKDLKDWMVNTIGIYSFAFIFIFSCTPIFLIYWNGETYFNGYLLLYEIVVVISCIGYTLGVKFYDPVYYTLCVPVSLVISCLFIGNIAALISSLFLIFLIFTFVVLTITIKNK
ncbi:Transmembrane domain-containing protein [Orpheovirus IHUMI-LCC2]|uniref:Transmembrane domain-containing protein n=1 Tax=Orpheovirus IHUMI-LCC2 TaxID=2023057 RepID=A0A2I2L5M4_9VIRU|nr:Transmembrane domain-containing protein [Orpheovirus IHUMI-LCC2]SNW62827.1 Transmembrane domain-containing protein [Orpheovirus IHUMI-LCC2]